MRKTQEAIRIARKARRRQGSKGDTQLQPQGPEFSRFVILLTTFSTNAFPTKSVLERQRTRWQVEVVSSASRPCTTWAPVQAGRREFPVLAVRHAPGNLLVEKLIHDASANSLWGNSLEAAPSALPLARL